jgi:hypothetical protein
MTDQVITLELSGHLGAFPGRSQHFLQKLRRKITEKKFPKA